MLTSLDELKTAIANLRTSPFTGIQPIETEGLETLRKLTDTSDLLNAAKTQFETVSSPEIMARLTASGFGRSGAVGESLSKGFANMVLPITQMGYQARSNFGQAQLGLGQQLANRGQARFQDIIKAQALLEQLGFNRDEAARNAEQFAKELSLRTRQVDIEALAASYQNALRQSQAVSGGGLYGSPFDFSPETRRVAAFNAANRSTPDGNPSIIYGNPAPVRFAPSTPSTSGGTTNYYGGEPGGSWNFGPGLRTAPFGGNETINYLLRNLDVPEGYMGE